MFRRMCDEVGPPCRKGATGASGFPASGRPWWNLERSLGAVQHHKGLSFLLSPNGLQALDKLNYSLVDLLGSLLLGPMTAT
jgi:hypothetical protein